MPFLGCSSLCEEKQKIIVSRDKGSEKKHIANNAGLSEVTHYKIDDIANTDGNNGSRCDFILINEDKFIAYLIELKGRHLIHAVKQLESTEQTLKEALAPYSLKYRIVANKSRTQEIEHSSFKRFKEKKGIALRYGTNQIEEDI